MTLASLVLLAGGCAELPAAHSGGLGAATVVPRCPARGCSVGVLVAGWHSGLVLPVGELAQLRPVLSASGSERYVSIGWGNRRFYMAARPGSGQALAALFRSSSVLFVQGAAALPELLPDEGELRWVCARPDQLARLDAYLRDSLRWRSGRAVELGAGPLPGSRFYASSGHYDALHTCNTWSLAALEYAGLPVSAEGVIFAAQVRHRVQGLAPC